MTDAPPIDLSVIIVSWNVRDLLRACLNSLQQSSGLSFEAVVIDNASSDGTAAMVADEFPWVRLQCNAGNDGFTVANNQGLVLSRGRYVLFLNPDTQVIGAALTTMVAYMDGHTGAGALGPQLRYGDGRLQSSRRRFPTLATGFFESTPLAWHWPAARNPWARRYHMDDVPVPDLNRDTSEAQTVDWVVGAALLVRRAAVDQLGGFDESFFMYSEELDWCRRAKEAGWQIVYLPAAQVIHHEGKSSEQIVAARHIRFQTSRIRYFSKYDGPAAAGFLRLSLLAMFAAEWLIEATKCLLGSRRDLRRERMAAYDQLLKTGLRT
jgi:N-acetylglucosaminyl-diphospho-decaprenol L-rhamnosyltransferase